MSYNDNPKYKLKSKVVNRYISGMSKVIAEQGIRQPIQEQPDTANWYKGIEIKPKFESSKSESYSRGVDKDIPLKETATETKPYVSDARTVVENGQMKQVPVFTTTPQRKLSLEDYSNEYDSRGNIIIPEKRINKSIANKVNTAVYNSLNATGIDPTSGMGTVLTSVMNPIFTGLEQMQRGNKEKKFGREITDNILGLATIWIGSIPAMVGVNSLIPAITEFSGNVAENLGMSKETGEKIGHLISFVPFGPKVILAGLTSTTAGDFVAKLLEDKDISETDKERIIETAHHIGFFGGLGTIGLTKNVYRNLKTRADINSLSPDKLTPQRLQNAISEEIQKDNQRQVIQTLEKDRQTAQMQFEKAQTPEERLKALNTIEKIDVKKTEYEAKEPEQIEKNKIQEQPEEIKPETKPIEDKNILTDKPIPTAEDKSDLKLVNKSLPEETVYHGGYDLGKDLVLKLGHQTGKYTGQDSGAIYFTPSKKYAQQYMKHPEGLYEYKLNSTNIFDATNKNHLDKLKDGFTKNWEEEYSSKEDAINDYNQAKIHIINSIREGAVDWATAGQWLEQISKAGFEGAKFLERPAENIKQTEKGFELSGEPVYSYAIFKDNIKVNKVKPDITDEQYQKSKEGLENKPIDLTTTSQKYRIGRSPMTYSLVERLPFNAKTDLPDEKYVKIKNDKTGEVFVSLESDLKPIKQSEPVDANQHKIDLIDKKIRQAEKLTKGNEIAKDEARIRINKLKTRREQLLEKIEPIKQEAVPKETEVKLLNEVKKPVETITIEQKPESVNKEILKEKTAEELFELPETKIRLRNIDIDAETIRKEFHAKTKNYKDNTYYHVETKNGESGVGEGLYLGKDKEALQKFYDIGQEGYEVKTYKGDFKFLDLTDYDKFDKFEKEAKNKYPNEESGNEIKKLAIEKGYDGIRYYDPEATGEEFVLYNLKKLTEQNKSLESKIKAIEKKSKGNVIAEDEARIRINKLKTKREQLSEKIETKPFEDKQETNIAKVNDKVEKPVEDVIIETPKDLLSQIDKAIETIRDKDNPIEALKEKGFNIKITPFEEYKKSRLSANPTMGDISLAKRHKTGVKNTGKQRPYADINQIIFKDKNGTYKIPIEYLQEFRDKISKLDEYKKAKKTIKEALKKDSGISFGGLSKLSDLSDTKVLKAVYTIGKYHYENGAKTLKDFSRAVIKEVGNWIKPHLRTLWNELTKDRTGLDNVITQGFSILPESVAHLFRSRGKLPEQLHKQIETLKAKQRANNVETQQHIRDFRKAVLKEYGRKSMQDRKFAETLNDYLTGNKTISVKPQTKLALDNIRKNIDKYSQDLLNTPLLSKELTKIVGDNMGEYLTRFYERDYNKKWENFIYNAKEGQEIYSEAEQYIKKQWDDAGKSYTSDELAGELQRLMQPVRDEFSPNFSQGKETTIDRSTLKHREDIPEEIRNLMGEFKDPLANYSRSVFKMGNMISKAGLLANMRKEGLGKYLYDKPVKNAEGDFTYKIADKDNPAYKPLTEGKDIYTTKDIAESLEQAFNEKETNPLVKLYQQSMGLVRYGKTALSPVTTARNIISNPVMLLANGYTNFHQTHKGIKLSDAEKKRLTELNIIGSSANLGELRDVTTDIFRQQSDTATMRKNAFKTAKDIFDKPGQFYGAIDDVFKVQAFKKEMQRYKNSFKDELRTGKLKLQDLEKQVAEIVTAVLPTYSKVPPIIKKYIRRLPIGNFVSFPAEIIRTMYNIPTIAMKEMKNPKTRNIGIERMGAFIGTLTAVSSLPLISRMLSGVSTEEEHALRGYLPDWQKNSQFFHLGKDEKGNYNLIDLSYTDPYNYIKKPVLSMLWGNDPVNSMTEGIKEFLSPFVTEEILAKTILDISRNKDTDRNKEIYNEEDIPSQQAMDMLEYALSKVSPGFVTQAQRIKKATDEEKTVNKRYDVKNELLGLTGIRKTKINPEDVMTFSAIDLKKELNRIKTLETKAQYQYKDNKEKLAERLEQINGLLNTKYEDFKQTIEDAKTLGLKDYEIRIAFEQAGLSKDQMKALTEDKIKYYSDKSELLNLNEDLQEAGLPKYELRDSKKYKESTEGKIDTTRFREWLYGKRMEVDTSKSVHPEIKKRKLDKIDEIVKEFGITLQKNDKLKSNTKYKLKSLKK